MRNVIELAINKIHILKFRKENVFLRKELVFMFTTF
jgi:hypothetical protein